MDGSTEILRIGTDTHDRVADALSRAFVGDPMWSCIVPDRETQRDVLRPMWHAVIGYARVYGEALTTPDACGAACWIAPGRTKTTIWKLLRTGFGLPRSMFRLPKDARGRFMKMMRFLDGHHGTLIDLPHWHLMALGVAPEAQGTGMGSALLTSITGRNDVPCYLETETEENVAFYRKRGFEVLLQEAEPACGLPIWFMRRDPQRAASSSRATDFPARGSR